MKRTPLKQRSAKRAREMRTKRAPEVQRLNEEGAPCEVCPVLHRLGIPIRCEGRIGGLHERRKSGAGGSRENPANLMAACNLGNGYLEDAVGEHRDLIDACDELVVRAETHPEWDALGVRAWRER